MPIYEYECSKCRDTFEMIQSFSDKPLKKCKKCGGPLHKLVSECSFHLKGTGWYVTDYGGKSGKSPSSTPAASSSTKTTDTPKEKSKPKSESKPSTSKSSSSTDKKT